MNDEKFNYLLDCVDDLVSDLMYYDRKECDTVSYKDCEDLTDAQLDLLALRFQFKMNELKDSK